MNTLPPFAARLLALVLVAGSITVAYSAPRWEQVVSSGPGHYYIDPASITKDGERRTFDSALDYRHPKTSAAGKAYQSVATQFQVNCRMKMARIVHMTYYSGPMLAGSVVERQGMLHEWMEVDASSPVHRLMRYAC
jgi:hypothetical protein